MKKLEELGISPAPWFARILHWDKNRVDGIEDANGETIVETDSGVYPPKLPDARMLAAAPDLYDALQQIMQCWGASVFDEGGMACDTPLYCKHAGCGPKTCPVFLRAKSALAKAAGEETK